MRTKLDEIVEAFFGTDEKPVFYPDGPRRAVMAAVEKAFRHGVERGNAVTLWKSWPNPLSLNDVQPAAVDEKCPRCGHTPHPNSPCSSGPFNGCGIDCGDRRKAERRKVQWWRLKTEPIEFPAEIDCPVGVPYEKYPLPDRRSGNDRRKP